MPVQILIGWSFVLGKIENRMNMSSPHKSLNIDLRLTDRWGALNKNQNGNLSLSGIVDFICLYTFNVFICFKYGSQIFG